jgi:tRNA (guanine37-N1)-methyltransferase
MKIDIITLFPDMFNGPFAESIVKRAQDEGKVEIAIHNLRNWCEDNYKSVDDKPYGGGAGMVMRVDVIDRAVNDLRKRVSIASLQNDETKVILLDTKGEMYKQGKAVELSKVEHLILICGHYEGVDHRVHEHIVDEVICVGPYVLTGGELPAMVIVDSIVRLLPRVISEESLKEESFGEEGKIEYPHYTRPEEYNGWKVPEILLSGNHAEIGKWRKSK